MFVLKLYRIVLMCQYVGRNLNIVKFRTYSHSIILYIGNRQTNAVSPILMQPRSSSDELSINI